MSGDWAATRRIEEKALEPYTSMVMERCPHKDLLRFILAGVLAYVRDNDKFFDECVAPLLRVHVPMD